MPRWLVSRPIDGQCNESELAAYRVLSHLDDTWTVRWGYQYLSDNTAREGDFLILGPDGKLLVLEVKKRDRVFLRTGASDGSTANRSADVDQVQSQKAGVIAALKEVLKDNPSRDFEVPFTSPAIFAAKGSSFDRRSKAFPISVLRGAATLAELPTHWADLTAGGSAVKKLDRIRHLFSLAYGDASPEAEAKFLSVTDRLILDRLSADLSLLDSLAGNRQILVRGGAGSGKTWMADRYARNLAKEGKNVLFICYNKALGSGLKRDFSRTGRKKDAGSVTMHTWESLAEELAKRFHSQMPEKPSSKAGLDAYYEESLPHAMLEAVTSPGFEARFDALVVDEAQDHNTSPVNWWEIYLAQLKQGTEATVGIFYDPAQRPAFRKGTFDIDAVSGIFSQPAHFRILETRRYTRPVFDFLKSLDSSETKALVEGLHATRLHAGPEVVLVTHPSLDAAKAAASTLLKKWFTNNLVAPADTLVLTRKDPFSGTNPIFRNCETFAGETLVAADVPHALEKGNLRAASFNKSKGLDARAVILLDTYPWQDLPPGQRVGFWIAASRARQLLAICAHGKV